MLRSTVPEDTPTLLALTQETGFFKPIEIKALREVLDDYHAVNRAAGHRCITLERKGVVLGFAYYVPTAMTDRSWSLWWIVVSKTSQAGGLGSELLRRVEADAAAAAGRVLFVETSSLPLYEPTRLFYLKRGYEVAAVVGDYYADGDDLVYFRKRLSG